MHAIIRESSNEEYNLLHFVSTLNYNNNTPLNIDDLIKYCTNAASIHLNHRLKNEEFILKFNYSNLDIVLEAIAPLFIKNVSSGSMGIQISLQEWREPIVTEVQAEFFFKKVVSNRVDQHIFELLKEHDPHFARILQALNYQIKKNNYHKTHHLGTVYITEAPSDFHGELIDFDGMMRLDVKYLTNTFNLLINLFDSIKTQTNYLPAIPLNALVKKLKEVEIEELTAAISFSNVFDIEEQLNIENIINTSAATIFEKLHKDYIEKKKLNREEVILFESIILNFADDIKYGCTGVLFDYVRFFNPAISKEIYEAEYHHILDYLLRLLKKEIIKRLNES